MRFIKKSICYIKSKGSDLPKVVFYWYIIILISIFVLVFLVSYLYYRLYVLTDDVITQEINDNSTKIIDTKQLKEVLVKYKMLNKNIE